MTQIETFCAAVPTLTHACCACVPSSGVRAHCARLGFHLPGCPAALATRNMVRMSLPTPTLHTARLQLRPVTSADADALFAMHSSAYVLRYWDAPPWSERARAERFITACRQMAEEGSGARLAMDRVSDGAFIGWCGLTRWNPDYRSASLGYCLSDAAWGHGYATEAARALLQWAFDTLDLNRVQAETDTRNGASARVLESSASCVKVRCGKTASSTARCRTRGCTG